MGDNNRGRYPTTSDRERRALREQKTHDIMNSMPPEVAAIAGLASTAAQYAEKGDKKATARLGSFSTRNRETGRKKRHEVSFGALQGPKIDGTAITPGGFLSQQLGKFIRRSGIKPLSGESIKKSAMTHLNGGDALQELSMPSRGDTSAQSESPSTVESPRRVANPRPRSTYTSDMFSTESTSTSTRPRERRRGEGFTK